MWGSIFSFEGHKFLWKMPRRFPYPITINFGKAMPPTATPFEVRQTVQELLAEAWLERKKRMRPLHHSFVVSARRRPRRIAMVDALTPAVTFSGALTRSILLARRLKKVWAGQKMVGLLLPPSVGGALANWAALFCGKVPVNLNYTLSEESLASCAKQCELKTILTSRAFIEKVKLKLPGEILFLEDLMKPAPSLWEKLTALFIARCLPVAWVERLLNNEPTRTGDRSRDALFCIDPGAAASNHPAAHAHGIRSDGQEFEQGRVCDVWRCETRRGEFQDDGESRVPGALFRR